MTKYSKATLALKLKDYGFKLMPGCATWKRWDASLKRGQGYISHATVLEDAKQVGWTEPEIEQLKGALK